MAELSLLPDPDVFVISARSDDILVLWMSPGYLPAWSIMRLKLYRSTLYYLITFHSADLDYTVCVTTSHSVAEIVKLSIINHTCMFGIMTQNSFTLCYNKDY